MPPGRTFYDPFVQQFTPTVPPEEVERVEMWVDQDGRWNAHHVGPDRNVVAVAPGGVNRADVEQQCHTLWPGLTIYEVREGEDSTWVGHARPSPRAWQPGAPVAQAVAPVGSDDDHAVADTASDSDGSGSPSDAGAAQLRAIHVPAEGMWLHRDDAVAMLRAVAAEYDEQRNPSAAEALRLVADTWSE